MLLDQHLHRPAQRLRLLAEEARRVDVAFELVRRDGEVVLGAPVLLEQALGDPVDVHVRGLRREHHGHEQLQLGAEPQRDGRVGMLGEEAIDDRSDSLALGADAAPGLLDEAARH